MRDMSFSTMECISIKLEFKTSDPLFEMSVQGEQTSVKRNLCWGCPRPSKDLVGDLGGGHRGLSI